jgi:predicted phage tail protein
LTRGTPCNVPAAPQNFQVLVRPNTNEVTFRWTEVPGAEQYALAIGTTRGSSNRRRTNTTQLEYVVRGHPAGDFFARVAAVNSCGGGNSSNEVSFHVGQPPQ